MRPARSADGVGKPDVQPAAVHEAASNLFVQKFLRLNIRHAMDIVAPHQTRAPAPKAVSTWVESSRCV
jgi:hypothetical protein